MASVTAVHYGALVEHLAEPRTKEEVIALLAERGCTVHESVVRTLLTRMRKAGAVSMNRMRRAPGTGAGQGPSTWQATALADKPHVMVAALGVDGARIAARAWEGRDIATELLTPAQAPRSAAPAVPAPSPRPEPPAPTAAHTAALVTSEDEPSYAMPNGRPDGELFRVSIRVDGVFMSHAEFARIMQIVEYAREAR